MEVCVAIRSALLKRNELNLFAGAGIVSGSLPEEEWNEVENKIDGFLDIIKEII